METGQNDLPESLPRLDGRLVLSRIPIVAYSTTATLDDVLHVQEALRNLALEHHEAEPATCPCHLVDHHAGFRDSSELLEIRAETLGSGRRIQAANEDLPVRVLAEPRLSLPTVREQLLKHHLVAKLR